MDEVLTQIWIMVDCLNKKIESLNAVIVLTQKQTEAIVNFPNDNKYFNELVENKQQYINYINDLDGIFANIFGRVKDFMGKGNTAHREAMIELQDKISLVTELTVKIKTIEEKNARALTGGVSKPPKKLISAKKAVQAYKNNKKF